MPESDAIASNEPVRIRVLDGVRGLAILLVMAFHFTRFMTGLDKFTRFGWAGVDLFFVLSGFLITRVLWDLKPSPRYYPIFYWRRLLRILPLYYAVLAAGFYFFPLITPGVPLPQSLWYVLHVSNFYVAILGSWPGGWGLNPMWSLAIEEQFYGVWPWVIRRLRPSGLVKVCLALAFGSFALRTGARMAGVSSTACYVLPFMRMDGLLMGAALAGVGMFPGGLRRLFQAAGVVLGTGVVASLFMLWRDPMDLFSESSLGMQTVGYTLISLVFASLMVRVLVAPRSFLGRVFESPFLAFFGKYSYGLYLVHEPVNWLLRHWFYRRNPAFLTSSSGRLMHLVCALGISVAVAFLSWHLFEKQWLKLKDWGGRRDFVGKVRMST